MKADINNKRNIRNVDWRSTSQFISGIFSFFAKVDCCNFAKIQ